MFTPDQPINDNHKETEWVTCPKCLGAKGEYLNDESEDDTPLYFEKCTKCDGTGEVEADESDNFEWD